MQLPPTSAPLWQRPPATYPPLAEDRDADVVVIGAGIAGLTTAALLTEAGREVVVLEARTVGSGTSGRTTAKASALQGTRYQQLVDLHGEEAAARYARAHLDGLDWLASRAAHVRRVGWDRRPAVTYATTVAGRRTVEAEAAAARAAGLDVELADAALPFATTAAVWLADQAQFDPGPYLAALAADVARSPNGTVHEGTRATGIGGSRRLRVTTEHGTVRARDVVVATLLPIVDRGLFFARAAPKSSYLIAVTVDEPPPGAMYLSADSPTRSLRTAPHDGGEVLLVGGGGHDPGRGAPTSERYRGLAEWAARNVSAREVVARWSAHDYVPADHLPWVGSSAILSPNVRIATGFEKWGMTMGTAAGLALADQILGRDGPSRAWAGLFDPRRLTPRGLVTAAKLNAKVAGRLASDWVHPDAAPGPDGFGGRRRRGLVPSGDVEPDGDRVDVVCTHLGGVCEWNDGDRTWDCPLHGSRFAADGTVVTAPAIRPLHRRGGRSSESAD
ncbi:MAG: FAD-dependent oxidoreductase [Aquihabitans sp.]